MREAHEIDYTDQHACLVRALAEHDALGEPNSGTVVPNLGAPAYRLPEPQVFEPVVIVRRDKVTMGRGVRIDSFVKLEGGEGMTIGDGVHIASGAHVGIGGGTTILEDFSAVASGARVISGSNQDDSISMSATAPAHMQHIIRKVTTLKRFAVVLCNAVVMPGVTLGEGAVLAAGAVATKDIPEWEVWAGVPARFLRKRVVTR